MARLIITTLSIVVASITVTSIGASAQTVQDGDSIIRGDGVRVRLYGIDAPEKDQPYGREARKILKQYMPLVAKMKEYDEDRYGRLIVELFTEDSKSINAAMICSGAAWWYEYYAPDRPQFKQCQEDAQKAKRGLWADEKSCTAVELEEALAANPRGGLSHLSDNGSYLPDTLENDFNTQGLAPNLNDAKRHTLGSGRSYVSDLSRNFLPKIVA